MQSKLLSEFAHSINYSSLPKETVDMAKMCVQDLIGVAMAGSRRAEADIWKQYFTRDAQEKQATVWSPGLECCGYRQAAALNSAYGHLLDMDDVHNSSISHLGVVTIPAAIAVGQRLGKSGKEVIAAIVAGYEVGARIGEAINPESYWYWHTTSVVGTFTAATAAGKLLGLSKEQLLNCFGSAGTQSAGVWQFLADGAMSKSLHTANATLCGIRAAELSLLGLTGAREILEGERGLIRAIAPAYNLDALTRNYANPYSILANSFKPYACCRHTHSAGYAIERILAAQPIAAEEIVKIVDRTYRMAANLTDNPNPTTPYAYKFSLQYCIAAAIVYRDLSDKSFSEERTKNPAIRHLMDKVKIVVDDTLEQEYRDNPNQWTHLIEITTADGKTYGIRVDYPIGDFNNPFTCSMADNKLAILTGEFLPDEKRARLIENINHLENMDNINQLFEL